jgi:hypothetical protein
MTAPHHPLRLFGGRLCGDRIVRLVYIDEPGISNPAHEPFLVVAGVIVDADRKLVAVERHIEKLAARWIPEGQRPGFVFHATEIFNGGGKVFRRHDPSWPVERRLEIAASLAEIPRRFDLPVAIGFVDRANAPGVQRIVDNTDTRNPTVAAHLLAFMSCAMQIEHWMRRNTKGEVCMLIVEDNEQARRILREQLVEHQRPEIALGLDEQHKKHFPLRKIKQRPSFEPKDPRSVLQLADFCAYVAKRVFARPDDAHWARFYEPWRRQLVTFSPGQVL